MSFVGLWAIPYCCVFIEIALGFLTATSSICREDAVNLGLTTRKNPIDGKPTLLGSLTEGKTQGKLLPSALFHVFFISLRTSASPKILYPIECLEISFLHGLTPQ